jgi:hypothetical protein
LAWAAPPPAPRCTPHFPSAAGRRLPAEGWQRHISGRGRTTRDGSAFLSSVERLSPQPSEVVLNQSSPCTTRGGFSSMAAALLLSGEIRGRTCRGNSMNKFHEELKARQASFIKPRNQGTVRASGMAGIEPVPMESATGPRFHLCPKNFRMSAPHSLTKADTPHTAPAWCQSGSQAGSIVVEDDVAGPGPGSSANSATEARVSDAVRVRARAKACVRA